MSKLQLRRGIWDAREPEAYAYDITEIATSLSRIVRFLGHTEHAYSVAEHSVRVCDIAAKRTPPVGVTLSTLCICALLHDASEAFLNDVPGPVKLLPELAGYRALEAKAQDAILRAFGIWMPAPTKRAVDEVVAEADRMMCEQELGLLFGSELPTAVWPADVAETRFLLRARQLGLHSRQAA